MKAEHRRLRRTNGEFYLALKVSTLRRGANRPRRPPTPGTVVAYGWGLR